jgi:thiol-disulfide isomerase/thioredoxin
VIPVLLAAATLLAGEVDAAKLHQAVRAQRGRPVVVNFWATWCEPCVHEFPDFVALARDRKDVAFISVTIDDTDDRPAVEDFVKKQQPPFPVYLKAPGGDEAFIKAVDPKWSGAVPLTMIFDAAGERVHFEESEMTRQEVEAKLPPAKGALAKPGAASPAPAKAPATAPRPTH